ncbi:hypothetical protein HDU79_000299 [Rhizoclosmatium sp. JEL0117]|nr:hypothetical protein HDU79_000299 [Rhizoclosmatium sp. JEL0117]
MQVRVVGGGPAGLAAALSLVHLGCIPASNVTVFEQRQEPTRSNVILLSEVAVQRLKILGIDCIKSGIGNMTQLVLKGGSSGQESEAALIEFGGHLDLTYTQSTQLLLDSPIANTAADIIDAQSNGKGIVGVTLGDLERALKLRVKELGITITQQRVLGLVLTRKDKYALDLGTGTVIESDLIVLAEGASRSIATTSLNLESIPVSSKEHWARVHMQPNVGATVGVVFSNVNGTVQKRLLLGDPVQNRYTQLMLQIPAPFNHTSFANMLCGTEHELSTHNNTDPLIQQQALKFSNDISAVVPSIDSLTVESIALRSFVVQDCYLERVFVGNVAIVGDTARSGHFLTGVGTALAIVNDCDALLKLVESDKSLEAMKEGGQEFEDSIQSASRLLFAHNKEKWFAPEF